MAMDASDGGLGLGGSFVDNICFRAFFARGTHWSEGVRVKKREGIGCRQRSKSGTERDKRILFGKTAQRDEACCAAFLEQKLRARSFPATSQCELKSEIYQTFACVPFSFSIRFAS
jgi:hypothetical protein